MAYLVVLLALVAHGHAQAIPQDRGRQVIVEASPHSAHISILGLSTVDPHSSIASPAWMKWSETDTLAV